MTDKSPSRKAAKLSNNKNATKSTRKIEFGWVHNGIGVRGIKGGGTRRYDIAKTATIDVLIEAAKDLFFPGGISKRGLKVGELKTIEIRDFSHILLNSKQSVEEFVNASMLTGVLRYYLHTSGPSIPSSSSHTEVPGSSTESIISSAMREACGSDELPDLLDDSEIDFGPIMSSTFQILTDTMPLDPPTPHRVTVSSPTPTTPSNPPLITVEALAQSLAVSSSQSSRLVVRQESAVPTTPTNLLNIVPIHPVDLVICPSNPQPPLGQGLEQSLTLPNIQLSRSVVRQESAVPRVVSENVTERRVINIHRSRLLQEMVEIFRDKHIIYERISYHFHAESGQDLDGVTRDVYTAFWQEFNLNATIGETEKVPAIFPEYGIQEWEAVGRVLVKGLKDANIFPITFARAFMVAVVHTEQAVEEELLIDSYKAYLGPVDGSILEKALNNNLDDEDREDFMDILSRAECHSIPSHDDMKDALGRVAHKEIIQSSKYAMDIISRIARVELSLLLPTVADLLVLYEEKKPSVKRVIKLIESQPLDKAQEKTLGYLKQYIKSLDESKLAKFLRFVTGSDLIAVTKIDIQYNSTPKGLARTPVAHTCGPTLELPSTYSNYTELRADFTNILDSGYLKMDVL